MNGMDWSQFQICSKTGCDLPAATVIIIQAEGWIQDWGIATCRAHEKALREELVGLGFTRQFGIGDN